MFAAAIKVPPAAIVKMVRSSLTLGPRAKKYCQLHGVSQNCRISDANQLSVAWCIERMKEGIFVVWTFMSPEKMGFKYLIPTAQLPCQHVSSDRTSRPAKSE